MLMGTFCLAMVFASAKQFGTGAEQGIRGGLPPPPLCETRSLTVAPAAQNVEAGKLPNPKSVKRCCWSPYSSAGHVRLLSKRRPGAETLGGLEETRGPSGEFSKLHTLANVPEALQPNHGRPAEFKKWEQSSPSPPVMIRPSSRQSC